MADQISCGGAKDGAIDLGLEFAEVCDPVAGAQLPAEFDEYLTGLAIETPLPRIYLFPPDGCIRSFEQPDTALDIRLQPDMDSRWSTASIPAIRSIGPGRWC